MEERKKTHWNGYVIETLYVTYSFFIFDAFFLLFVDQTIL